MMIRSDEYLVSWRKQTQFRNTPESSFYNHLQRGNIVFEVYFYTGALVFSDIVFPQKKT